MAWVLCQLKSHSLFGLSCFIRDYLSHFFPSLAAAAAAAAVVVVVVVVVLLLLLFPFAMSVLTGSLAEIALTL